MTGAVPSHASRAVFLGANGAAMAVFACGYAAAQMLPHLRDRSLAESYQAVFHSPVTGWNLLMGGWLYLTIAGVSYSRRADASLREAERAHGEARVLSRDAQLAVLHAQLQPTFCSTP